MTSTTRKLTGAALAADITLGGFTSAYAQVLQPFGEPYSNEPVVIMDEDESLPVNGKGSWDSFVC